jgi:membrane protease YdiL (CAAX protease family)
MWRMERPAISSVGLPGPGHKEWQPPVRRVVVWGAADITAAALAVLLAFPVLIAAGRALIGLTPVSANAATIGVSIALQGLLLCTAWLFTVRRYGVAWSELGLVPLGDGRSLRYTAIAVLGSLAIVAAYGALVRSFGLEDRVPESPIFRETDPRLLGLGIAAATLIAPLIEEIFFRGFVFAGLRKSIGPVAAAVMASALFALAHMSPFLYTPVFLIGLLLTWVYYRTGCLWYNVLAHLSYNSLVAYIALANR